MPIYGDAQGRRAVELFRDRRRRWRYRVVGANGEKMVVSEPYGSQGDALRGLDDLIRRLRDVGMVEPVGRGRG